MNLNVIMLSLVLGILSVGSCGETCATNSAQTLDERIAYIKDLANNGDGRAQFFLGVAYKNGLLDVQQDLKEALHWLQLAADTQKDDAHLIQYELADLYCILKDYEKAIYWFKRSSDLGCCESSYKLGEFYCSGVRGAVERDLKKASHFFQLALDQGIHSGFNHDVSEDDVRSYLRMIQNEN